MNIKEDNPRKRNINSQEDSFNSKKNTKLFKLFEFAKKKNLFWSYSKSITLKDISDEIMIETILKYGDIYELNSLFEVFLYEKIRLVWIKNMIFDIRFKKLNFYLSKMYFDDDLGILKIQNNSRMKKLKLMALK